MNTSGSPHRPSISAEVGLPYYRSLSLLPHFISYNFKLKCNIFYTSKNHGRRRSRLPPCAGALAALRRDNRYVTHPQSPKSNIPVPLSVHTHTRTHKTPITHDDRNNTPRAKPLSVGNSAEKPSGAPTRTLKLTIHATYSRSR